MPVRLSSLDRRRQILRTASGIFARKGYRGTTTREIAERAGINEALLFRHFPSKEKLYWTLIEELCSARGRRRNISNILEAGGTDLEIFTAIAREMLVRNARDTELTRLLWFTALESHTLSQRFFRTFIAVYYEEWRLISGGASAKARFATSIRCYRPAGSLAWWFTTFWCRSFLGPGNFRSLIPKRWRPRWRESG